jgi:hypothetical protein
MAARIRFFVPGTPRQQGSKRAFVVRAKATGQARAVMVDDARAPLRDWHAAVCAVAMRHVAAALGPHEACALTLVFGLRRPKGHYSTRRGDPPGTLNKLGRERPWPTKKPDASKLLRAAEDALTSAGLYGDDCQIVRLAVDKAWTDGPEGLYASLRPAAETLATETDALLYGFGMHLGDAGTVRPIDAAAAPHALEPEMGDAA